MRICCAVFLIFCLQGTYCLVANPIAGIGSIRFASYSNRFPEGNDGVLEVMFNGSWGTICNYGFDELAASTACFMMGYEPRGVPILNSGRRSELVPLLSNFNCTGRIGLSTQFLSTATVHLGFCSFTNDMPADCLDVKRQTSIVCLDSFVPPITTTPVPNYATVAPVDCSSPTASTIRLVGGTDRAGLVEIIHPETHVWGTICADGINMHTARTLCRMLCTSDDNLSYAHPVLYQYTTPDDDDAQSDIPIHLSRISCPENARNLNECVLGGGWGATSGCTHAMDVGVECGPPISHPAPTEYVPELICNPVNATVRYNKSSNPDLRPNLLRLAGQVPAGCQFQTGETQDHIEAIIPLDGCDGSLSLSNESTIAVKLDLIRDHLAAEDGVISKLPEQFGIICLIPRAHHIYSLPLRSPNLTSDLTANSNGSNVTLKLYRDPAYVIELHQKHVVSPGERVNVMVSLKNTQPTRKLILEHCWATADPDRRSVPRKDLIVNRCAVYNNLTVHPISSSQVGFAFRAFYLGTSRAAVPISANLYIHCDTKICHSSETKSEFCQQFCRTPPVSSHGRRRRHGANRSQKMRTVSTKNTIDTHLTVTPGVVEVDQD